jgi:transposase-like protein
MSNEITTREQRGEAIAKVPNQIKRLDEDIYIVRSQSHEGDYCVAKVNGEWICQCSDYKYRHIKCKHIFAIEFSGRIRKEVQVNRVIQEVSVENCRYCGSSNLKKDGLRKNKSGIIQKFYCRNCKHYFTVNIGFERMKHNPQAITSAMQLYFSGESLRNTQRSLRLLGVEVSHKTVFMWIKKYVAIMKDYADKIVPNVSDTWRADELFVKIKGDLKYVFAMIDDETRFWIAQEVAESKHTHNAQKLFQMAQRITGKKPQTLITDGLQVYHDAYLREWLSIEDGHSEHVHKIMFTGRHNHNNNLMERFNGEVRDREKTMRGLKTKETPILQGYQIFHNYIRPHEALDGKTPSEACGIQIEGRNKWITLIQNAQNQKPQSHDQ